MEPLNLTFFFLFSKLLFTSRQNVSINKTIEWKYTRHYRGLSVFLYRQTSRPVGGTWPEAKSISKCIFSILITEWKLITYYHHMDDKCHVYPLITGYMWQRQCRRWKTFSTEREIFQEAFQTYSLIWWNIKSTCVYKLEITGRFQTSVKQDSTDN